MRLIDADELLNYVKAIVAMGESLTLTDFEELIKSRQTWCSDCKDYDHESSRCLKHDKLVRKERMKMREILKEKLK